MTEVSGNVVNVDGRDRRPWALISKENLLRAAISEIAESGYDRARLVDIAKKADLTVGAIYNWYGNKTELFNAALAFALAEQQQTNTDVLEAIGPAVGQGNDNSHWTLLIQALAPRNPSTDGHTDAQKMLLESLQAAWRDNDAQQLLRPQLDSLINQYETIIKNAIENGAIDESLDAELLARFFLAFPIGMSLLSLAGSKDIEMTKFIPFVQRMNEFLKPH